MLMQYFHSLKNSTLKKLTIPEFLELRKRNQLNENNFELHEERHSFMILF